MAETTRTTTQTAGGGETHTASRPDDAIAPPGAADRPIPATLPQQTPFKDPRFWGLVGLAVLAAILFLAAVWYLGFRESGPAAASRILDSKPASVLNSTTAGTPGATTTPTPPGGATPPAGMPDSKPAAAGGEVCNPECLPVIEILCPDGKEIRIYGNKNGANVVNDNCGAATSEQPPKRKPEGRKRVTSPKPEECVEVDVAVLDKGNKYIDETINLKVLVWGDKLVAGCDLKLLPCDNSCSGLPLGAPNAMYAAPAVTRLGSIRIPRLMHERAQQLAYCPMEHNFQPQALVISGEVLRAEQARARSGAVKVMPDPKRLAFHKQ